MKGRQPATISAFSDWFCVRTKARMEEHCVQGLASRGLSAFNPKIEVYSTSSHGKARRIVPMFCRYVFVRLRSTDDYYMAKWTPGVIEILCAGGLPIAVDSDVIKGIMGAISTHGYVKMSLPTTGDRVLVCSGALKGITGRLLRQQDGGRRTKLLLEIMQRNVIVYTEGIRIHKILGSRVGVLQEPA